MLDVQGVAPLSKYSRRSAAWDGLRLECKECVSSRREARRSGRRCEHRSRSKPLLPLLVAAQRATRARKLRLATELDVDLVGGVFPAHQPHAPAPCDHALVQVDAGEGRVARVDVAAVTPSSLHPLGRKRSSAPTLRQTSPLGACRRPPARKSAELSAKSAVYAAVGGEQPRRALDDAREQVGCHEPALRARRDGAHRARGGTLCIPGRGLPDARQAVLERSQRGNAAARQHDLARLAPQQLAKPPSTEVGGCSGRFCTLAAGGTLSTASAEPHASHCVKSVSSHRGGSRRRRGRKRSPACSCVSACASRSGPAGLRRPAERTRIRLWKSPTTCCDARRVRYACMGSSSPSLYTATATRDGHLACSKAEKIAFAQS